MRCSHVLARLLSCPRTQLASFALTLEDLAEVREQLSGRADLPLDEGGVAAAAIEASQASAAARARNVQQLRQRRRHRRQIATFDTSSEQQARDAWMMYSHMS